MQQFVKELKAAGRRGGMMWGGEKKNERKMKGLPVDGGLLLCEGLLGLWQGVFGICAF